jgi:hypothetical protein
MQYWPGRSRTTTPTTGRSQQPQRVSTAIFPARWHVDACLSCRVLRRFAAPIVSSSMPSWCNSSGTLSPKGAGLVNAASKQRAVRGHCLRHVVHDFSAAFRSRYPPHSATGCGGYLGNRRSECDKPHNRKRAPFAEVISRICRHVSHRLASIPITDIPIGSKNAARRPCWVVVTIRRPSCPRKDLARLRGPTVSVCGPLRWW